MLTRTSDRLSRLLWLIGPVCLWLALVPIDALAQGGNEPIVTTDLLRLRTIDSIVVSRDGTRAVFTVRSIQGEGASDERGMHDSYRYRSHLWMLDLATANSAPRQITFGRRNDSSPAISPDGRTLAFVRRGEGDHERSQVWLMPLNGGGEARPFTDFDRGAGSPVWAPDGLRLLVSSSLEVNDLSGVPTWPLERPQRTWKDADSTDGIVPHPDGSREEIRAWLEQNAAKMNPTVMTRLAFQDEQSLAGAMTFQHLFIIDTRSPEPVTRSNASQVTAGFYDHRDPAFMPGGDSLVYIKRKELDQHADRVISSDLWMIRTDGSDDRRLISYDGWTLSSPRPSTDGSVVAFLARQDDEPMFRQTRLGLTSTRTDREPSQPIWLTEKLDSSIRSFEWMNALGSIVFSTARAGAFPLMSISPTQLEPTVLVPNNDDQPSGVHVFGVGGGAVVYSQTSVQHPARLMVRTQQGTRLAMDLNPWVAEKRLSQPESGWIERPDGTRVQYWLMPPTNVEAGRKYPLVLQIHGGPTAMWGPGEYSMWHEFQLLCSWGYGVVYCNPRGSGGYGYSFQRANFQNWGAGPAGDCLAAVDQALLSDWVDPERLVVTGGSYAGYLTAWIVAHDQRFKAAVAQRGVYDLTTFFGEGNAWRLVEWAFGGFPWESNIRPILQRESPLTHVLRIRTPLLIMHASQDLRTGVSQSEMLYRALKVLNRSVEYVRYPGAGHDLSRSGDPIQRMDRLGRILEFFERHVRNDRPAPRIERERSDASVQVDVRSQ